MEQLSNMFLVGEISAPIVLLIAKMPSITETQQVFQVKVIFISIIIIISNIIIISTKLNLLIKEIKIIPQRHVSC